ncbi:thiazole synthase [Aliidiomarina maris]|uniref:Thiazole synthase n=1 Tax=Aliidiomarina maris TaxID=531312 RepID=A0A327WZJ1_9GAMM|nr:thiazole synthase [Aliidiomarina maris]MCL5051050.1 thiazole synthase [Bacillota bacterium]RAJ99045.1 thiazole-phosphate synthase [Aliidiomarina maris]RUO27791.1 thiazole synthase [Aliidiomarina maris]
MLSIADTLFQSRLLTGSGKFASPTLMRDAIGASGSQLVTLALKRIEQGQTPDRTLSELRQLNVQLLPNTSGAKTAQDAVLAAKIGRDLLGTHWVKLEIHPDPRYLLPDPIETLKAAEELVQLGFVVLPYCSADPTLCLRLQEVGCHAVMPLGSPIGSNQGLQTRDFLRIIIEQCTVPVIVDAGIGAPSHAAEAFELGADAVLVNTAIACASDPIAMARAFRLTCDAAMLAREGRISSPALQARATSPLTSFLER